MKEHVYFARYKDTKELAGLDTGSGGYPFRASSILHAKMWHSSSYEKSVAYVKMFPELEVCQGTIEVTPFSTN